MVKLSKPNAVEQAKWLLRIGLALVLLYAIIRSTLDPAAWIGFIPPIATHILSLGVTLKLFSFFQLMLVIWLLSGKFSRYAALVVALTMVGIIISNPRALDTTFRDVAILFAALALARLS